MVIAPFFLNWKQHLWQCLLSAFLITVSFEVHTRPTQVPCVLRWEQNRILVKAIDSNSGSQEEVTTLFLSEFTKLFSVIPWVNPIHTPSLSRTWSGFPSCPFPVEQRLRKSTRFSSWVLSLIICKGENQKTMPSLLEVVVIVNKMIMMMMMGKQPARRRVRISDWFWLPFSTNCLTKDILVETFFYFYQDFDHS